VNTELGVIEGYYGKTWSWAERAANITFLKAYGYGHYIYAPKADHYLRTRWREDHPDSDAQALNTLAQHCRSHAVRFGIGLSPLELYRDFNDEAKICLRRRLAQFDAWGVQDLAILFDDMRGDLPDLAATQVEILHFVGTHTKADRLIVCPSYYTDDPVLDRFFGQRPANYLEDLGRLLDSKISVFWTGEEVCSKAHSTGHLARVSEQLRRKPFLWDNYPVNDGHRMSQFLHIRGFTGRPAAIGPYLTAHSVNPALQPVLSRIPLLSLSESYDRRDSYEYGRAFLVAAETVCGTELAHQLQRDLLFLQDTGLDRLGDVLTRLYKRYALIDHDAAREVVRFLDGYYRFETQIA